MFCNRCGKAITDNSIFCMFCGAKIPLISTAALDITNAELSEAESSIALVPAKQRTFSVQSNTLTFDAGIEEYTILRKTFLSNFFDYCAESADKIQSQSISNLDDYLDIYLNYGLGVLNWLYDEAMNLLLKRSIFDVAKQQLVDAYSVEQTAFIGAYTNFEDKYASIIASAQELENYRALRKASRSRWVGGGFGVSGAIKGAVTAGALNLGTNMIRGIGDVIRSAADSAIITKKKKDLLKDNWLSNFAYHLLIDASEIFDAAIAVLDDRGVIHKPQVFRDQAQAYYENSRKFSEKNDKIMLLTKAIESSPYEQSYYFALSEVMGLYNADYITLAEFFLPDVLLKEIASDEHALFEKYVMSKSGNTYAELDNILAIFQKRMKIIKSLSKCCSDSIIVTFYIKTLFPKEIAMYKEFFGKRCTSEDGLKFESIQELNQYDHDNRIFKSYYVRREACWKLTEQKQLLEDLQNEGIISKPVLEAIASWNKYLIELQVLNENYKVSFHYYLMRAFSPENIAYAETVSDTMIKYLSQMQYGPIQRILYAQKLPYMPNFFSDKKKFCWLVITDYAATLIKDNAVAVEIDIRDLISVRFSSLALQFQMKNTKREIKLYTDSESKEFKLKQIFLTTQDEVNSALKVARENYEGKQCPQCASRLLPDALFCGDCGFRL